MKVLVVNCGSSSLKYQLIETDTEIVLAKGLCERIGIDGRLTHTPTGRSLLERAVDMPNHTVAVGLVLEQLVNPIHGVLRSLDEIAAVGHRVVHGGEKFASSVIITEEVLKEIEICNELAPLHNPPNLVGINACRELMPEVPMVAVFDTAFHQTMPPKAYLYGIPYEYYEKHKIRRYGFHGTSHSYVAGRAAQILGKDSKDLKIIVCHLGNGASVCAIKNGISIDTSMGFTPLEGLIMGTRCGDIDPAIIEFIADKEDLQIEDVLSILNNKSGVLGLSKNSSDFRDLKSSARHGDKLSHLALKIFCYHVAKYIGAYAAAMNGVDAVAFTAGLGENDPATRMEIGQYLEFMGIKIDPYKNDVHGEECIISTDNSINTALVIPTNEELAIARETVPFITG